MNEDYTSRKFITMLICLTLTSIAFFMGKIQSEYWLIFLLICIFGYGALNLVDKLLALKAGGTK